MCSAGGASLMRATRHLMNKLANLCCFAMAAAVFAMIGLDAGNQPGMTHSGSQEYVRHD